MSDNDTTEYPHGRRGDPCEGCPDPEGCAKIGCYAGPGGFAATGAVDAVVTFDEKGRPVVDLIMPSADPTPS